MDSTAKTEGREIILSRLINAPRELVFAVWTQQRHLEKWWGPTGFTTTTHEIEISPGGKWRFIMHGPDGTDFPNRITFTEINPPERITYIHDSDKDDDPIEFSVVVTFEDKNGMTEITQRSIFKSAEILNFLEEKYGAIEGGKQHLVRLEEYVTKQHKTN